MYEEKPEVEVARVMLLGPKDVALATQLLNASYHNKGSDELIVVILRRSAQATDPLQEGGKQE